MPTFIKIAFIMVALSVTVPALSFVGSDGKTYESMPEPPAGTVWVKKGQEIVIKEIDCDYEILNFLYVKHKCRGQEKAVYGDTVEKVVGRSSEADVIRPETLFPVAGMIFMVLVMLLAWCQRRVKHPSFYEVSVLGTIILTGVSFAFCLTGAEPIIAIVATLAAVVFVLTATTAVVYKKVKIFYLCAFGYEFLMATVLFMVV